MLVDRRVTVREIANELSLNVGSVETIIHERLKFSKVSARWVPKQLTDEHKKQRIDACWSLVTRYRKEQNEFLSRIIITCDETWVYHYTPKSKRSSMQRKHVSSPSPRKFKVQTRLWLEFFGTFRELFLWTLCLQDIL